MPDKQRHVRRRGGASRREDERQRAWGRLRLPCLTLWAHDYCGLEVPLVVRLEGTNVELGKKIIKESGLNVVPADNLDDAAQKIVKAVKEAA